MHRVTFYLPDDLAKKFFAAVPRGKRSKFVSEVIHKNLGNMIKERIISLEQTSVHDKNR